MKKNKIILKWLKKIAGIILIILGIVGLFLPFLQGIAMILIGATLLGNAWLLKKIRKAIKWIKKRF